MNSFGDKNIFVSYRRDDSTGDTFQLVKSLKQYIDGKRIFLDTEKLQPGEDFPKKLKQNLRHCDIVLVVIGKNWTAPKPGGLPSLMNENNWVRIEVATALKQNKIVIPLLLNGTPMPAKEDLPDVIKTLTNKHASEVYYRTWDNDVKELATFLQKTGVPFKEDEQRKSGTGFMFSKWSFAILVAVSIGLYFIFQNVLQPGSVPAKPSEIYSPGNSALKVLRRNTLPAAKYSIAGKWIVENAAGTQYYMITNTLNGLSLQVWDNNTLQSTGTVLQRDSLVTITYQDKRAGEIIIKAILSEDKQKLSGTRTLGALFKIKAAIGITLVKASAARTSLSLPGIK